MSDWRTRALGCLGVLAIFVGIPSLFLLGMSFSFLKDPQGQVTAAWLVFGEERKAFSKIPWGPWVTYVDGDASILVRCKNGRMTQGGYVTGLLADDYTVTGKCELKSPYD